MIEVKHIPEHVYGFCNYTCEYCGVTAEAIEDGRVSKYCTKRMAVEGPTEVEYIT